MIQTKNKFLLFLKKTILLTLLFFSVFFFQPLQKLYAFSHDWIAVPKNEYGEQSWDKKSLKNNLDGSVRVLSRFIPKTKSEITKDIFYIMDINCFEQSYRDVAVGTDEENKFFHNSNGWEKPNGDQLILGVIRQVCNFKQ